MKRFEYTTFVIQETDDTTEYDELNRLGTKGWELVCVVRKGYGNEFILKREIQDG